MIKLSKLTDYAVVILAKMHDCGQESLSASFLAQQTHISEPAVSKVLKLLAKADILSSSRGARGGYTLCQSAEDIVLTQIIEAIEGPIALTACVDGSHDQCSMSSSCSMAGRWTPVNQAIKTAFDSVSLKDMLPRCTSGTVRVRTDEIMRQEVVL